jgi:hypothetical protein
VATRRAFLAGLVTVSALAGFADGWAAGQALGDSQDRKPTQEPVPENKEIPPLNKKVLDDNEKDIKKKVERLYELATELKTEVDKTDSSKVLSVNLVKKAEEIEKLARDIKNRSKG